MDQALIFDGWKTDDSVEAQAEPPVADEKYSDVRVHGNRLIFSEEKKFERKGEQEGECRLMVRAYGSFARHHPFVPGRRRCPRGDLLGRRLETLLAKARR